MARTKQTARYSNAADSSSDATSNTTNNDMEIDAIANQTPQQDADREDAIESSDNDYSALPTRQPKRALELEPTGWNYVNNNPAPDNTLIPKKKKNKRFNLSNTNKSTTCNNNNNNNNNNVDSAITHHVDSSSSSTTITPILTEHQPKPPLSFYGVEKDTLDLLEKVTSPNASLTKYRKFVHHLSCGLIEEIRKLMVAISTEIFNIKAEFEQKGKQKNEEKESVITELVDVFCGKGASSADGNADYLSMWKELNDILISYSSSSSGENTNNKTADTEASSSTNKTPFDDLVTLTKVREVILSGKGSIQDAISHMKRLVSTETASDSIHDHHNPAAVVRQKTAEEKVRDLVNSNPRVQELMEEVYRKTESARALMIRCTHKDPIPDDITASEKENMSNINLLCYATNYESIEMRKKAYLAAHSKVSQIKKQLRAAYVEEEASYMNLRLSVDNLIGHGYHVKDLVQNAPSVMAIDEISDEARKMNTHDKPHVAEILKEKLGGIDAWNILENMELIKSIDWTEIVSEAFELYKERKTMLVMLKLVRQYKTSPNSVGDWASKNLLSEQGRQYLGPLTVRLVKMFTGLLGVRKQQWFNNKPLIDESLLESKTESNERLDTRIQELEEKTEMLDFVVHSALKHRIPHDWCQEEVAKASGVIEHILKQVVDWIRPNVEEILYLCGSSLSLDPLVFYSINSNYHGKSPLPNNMFNPMSVFPAPMDNPCDYESILYKKSDTYPPHSFLGDLCETNWKNGHIAALTYELLCSVKGPLHHMRKMNFLFGQEGMVMRFERSAYFDDTSSSLEKINNNNNNTLSHSGGAEYERIGLLYQATTHLELNAVLHIALCVAELCVSLEKPWAFCLRVPPLEHQQQSADADGTARPIPDGDAFRVLDSLDQFLCFNLKRRRFSHHDESTSATTFGCPITPIWLDIVNWQECVVPSNAENRKHQLRWWKALHNILFFTHVNDYLIASSSGTSRACVGTYLHNFVKSVDVETVASDKTFFDRAVKALKGCIQVSSPYHKNNQAEKYMKNTMDGGNRLNSPDFDSFVDDLFTYHHRMVKLYSGVDARHASALKLIFTKSTEPGYGCADRVKNAMVKYFREKYLDKKKHYRNGDEDEPHAIFERDYRMTCENIPVSDVSDAQFKINLFKLK